MKLIPLAPIPNQELMVSLDGQNITLHVYQRGERLYLDIAMDNETLRYGAVCLPGLQIGGIMYPFEGMLIFTDEKSGSTKAQKPPTYEGLGTRFFLYYCNEDESYDALDEYIEELGIE